MGANFDVFFFGAQAADRAEFPFAGLALGFFPFFARMG